MKWSPRYCEVRDESGKLVQRTVQHTENGPIELLFPLPSGFVDSKINPIKRQWVGLTDEDVMELFANLVVLKQDYKDPVDAFKAICLASDAKLKEKNT